MTTANNQMTDSKICIIGLGYIGLPTAAMIASRGFNVLGVDINESVVNVINNGDIHIVEPELDMLVHGAVTTGKLRASTQVEASDVFVIAVPTPLDDNNAPQLKYVKSAVISVASKLKRNDLIILESTSPVGTTEKMVGWLRDERPDLTFPVSSHDVADVALAYCPERVLPGKILKELVDNDRVIGGITPTCTEKAIRFYQQFVSGECVRTDARTAEMTKLTENAFRDVNIAFANELSMICNDQGINPWELIALANRHPRVNILKPGPGVGGHCIAVDPWFIVDSAPDKSKLIRAAREVNQEKEKWVLDEVAKALKNHKNPIVAAMGLSFKPDIDDLRESPSVRIVEKIARLEGCEVRVVEPHIDALPEHLGVLKNVNLMSQEDAIKEADIVLMLVNHTVFASLDSKQFEGKHVIDTQGLMRGSTTRPQSTEVVSSNESGVQSQPALAT